MHPVTRPEWASAGRPRRSPLSFLLAIAALAALVTFATPTWSSAPSAPDVLGVTVATAAEPGSDHGPDHAATEIAHVRAAVLAAPSWHPVVLGVPVALLATALLLLALAAVVVPAAPGRLRAPRVSRAPPILRIR